ncbi:MAG: hypothetical protein ABSA52_08595 [Candidatus Binatia bacterium]|jgi:hypothetical protein
MTYADRYWEELAYFRADLPILTAEKIAQRCRTLSLLLTAAIRCGEIGPTQLSEERPLITVESASHDASI